MPSPRYWREIPQRYRLEANKCKKCGKVLFPPRLICPNCGAKEFVKVRLSNAGKIITFTIIRVAPEQFTTEAPYVVAVVETEDGVRVTTRIADCKPEEVEIGQPVKLVFRKLQKEGKTGVLCYGYKAILV